ncbi:MAG: translocation/assembly module TamB domain-containing protein [Proteobacteria bacterium]|nr:translocation/assembly module TamB domain-containing protein [Pseudomonadota bacterium]
MRDWSSIGRKALHASLIGLAAIALLLIGLLRTPPGHATLAFLVEELTGGQVSVQGLSGDLPDDLHANVVEIRDAKGVWLRIEDVSLGWSAARAMDNHILIHRVTAAKIAMLRMPQAEEASEGTTPQIDVDSLSAPRIEIAQAVMGHAALLQAQGSLHYESVHQARADVTVMRLDDNDRYIVRGSIEKDVANGTVSIAEGANGILAALMGLPGLKPIALEARAQGDSTKNDIAFRLAAGALRASGQGTLSLANRAADVGFSASAPAMQPDTDLAWASLAMQGHIQGDFDTPRIAAKFQAAGVTVDGTDFGQIDADVNGSNGVVNLEGTANGVRIQGDHPDIFAHAPVFVTAQANLASPSRPVRFSLSHPLASIKGSADTQGRTKIDADMTIPSLAPFAALEGEDVRGSASFHVAATLDAQTTRFALNGRVDAQGASLIARMLGRNATLALQADLDGGNIMQSKVSVQGAGLKMQGAGSFRNKSLDYNTHLELLDLSRLAATLSGTAMLSGTAIGPLKTAQLHASGSADMASKGFARQRVGIVMQAVGIPNPASAQLRVQGSLDNARVAIDAALASAANGKARNGKLAASWKSLDVQANAVLPQAGPVTGSAKIGLRNIADMASFIGAKIAGSLNATVDLKAHGAQAVAAIKAQASGVSVAGNKAGAVAVQGAVADPFAKPSLDLVAGVRKFEAGGVSGDAEMKLMGPLGKLSVALKSDLRDAAQNPVHLAASAVLDAPNRRVAVQKLNADWRKQVFTLRAPAVIDFANGVAVDRFVVSVGGGEAQLSGRLTPKLAASFSARGIQAQTLQAFVPQLSATGTLSASAQLSGTLDAPQGAIAVQGRDLRVSGYSTTAIAPANLDLRATLRGKAMSLNASLSAGSSAHLTAAGGVPLQAGKLALHLGGNADLAMFNPFLAVDGRQAKGALAIDMNIAGTLAAPRAIGSVTLSKGELRDFARGLRLQDVSATMQADGEVLHVTRLSAQAGHGTISGSGTIDLAAPGMPIDVSVTAQDARPIVSDLMTVTFSGDAKLSGKLKGAMNLSGKVFVTQGEIDLPERFPPEVAVLDVRRRGQKPPPPPAPASSVALDVTITTRGQFFVRGHGIDADLGGRIHLTGTSATPFVAGGFKMNRGTFSMAGQVLDFTTGEVRFDGTGVRNRLDPTLNFVAQTASGGVTATLTVGGYASAPKVALSSSPQLPQDEVLAHLLFRQSVKQLTPLQLAQIAQAVAALGGIGSGFNPLGSIRKTLGLDRLSVGSTNGGAAGSDQQTTVEAGKYVARNVYVGAKQSLSGGTQVQVQVDLTRKLKAQATLSTMTDATATKGSAAQDNGSSVGLSYQFEY